MLSLQKNPSSQSTTPNILPCKITHSGPHRITKTHWDPTSNPQTVHFRGRKLLGKTVKLPEGYEGVVLKKAEKTLPVKREDEDGEEPVEVKIMEQKGKFEELVVWGHEALPDEEDAYRKGIEEWVGFAEAVCERHYFHELLSD